MRAAYYIKKDEAFNRVSNSAYNKLFSLLQFKNPKAEFLAEDPELSVLCDLLTLYRRGHIKLIHAYDAPETLLILEIVEQPHT